MDSLIGQSSHGFFRLLLYHILFLNTESISNQNRGLHLGGILSGDQFDELLASLLYYPYKGPDRTHRFLGVRRGEPDRLRKR